MTIKVTVTNSDSRESAVISVETQPGGALTNLKGGESTELYVHSQQDLHVREVSQ